MMLRAETAYRQGCTSYSRQHFKVNVFKAPPVGGLFEPTCAHARWALMHRFLSVCTGPKIRLEKKSYLETYYR